MRRKKLFPRRIANLARGDGKLVPRADREAVVAAVDAVAHGGAELHRDRAVVLDAQVGEAAGGVELIGRGDRSRGADVDATAATAAVIVAGAVSGQLEAEIYATALGKVYTFGPTFRAENSNTSRHLAEFWMIEPEMAFYDLNDNMDLAEQFLKRVFRDALENCSEDMDFFAQRIEKTAISRLEAIVDSQFERVTYTDAIEILSSSGEKFEYPISWGNDLQSEHERYLTEKKFNRPVILYDYPSTIKP